MRSWWKVKKWLRVLRQLRSLDEALLFLRILGVAAAVPGLLRLSLPVLLARLDPKDVPPPAEPARIQQIVRCVDAVLQLGRPLVRPGCLTRGVTLFYFLRCAGLEVALYFGMGQVEGQWVGHCWLVKEGEPYLERHDPRSQFTEIYRFPEAGSTLPTRPVDLQWNADR